MNHLDHTGRIPEFGRTHNTYRHRRAMATIAALCAVAFIYDAFPAAARIIDITALAIIVAVGIVLVAWLAHRYGRSRS